MERRSPRPVSREFANAAFDAAHAENGLGFPVGFRHRQPLRLLPQPAIGRRGSGDTSHLA
jgi:hypothetical protein